MPSTYDDVGQNARRAQESSNFGTRKLAFYTFTCDQAYNMVGATIPGGYSFRVNTVTGVVSFDATITERNVVDMYQEFYGTNGDEIDDDWYPLGLPFNVDFLGNGTTDTVYINSNSGISFYQGSSDRTSDQGPGNTSFDPTYSERKQILLANNDGCLQQLYTEATPGHFRVKFLGNTDYNIDSEVNLVWEAVFYDGESYIDFLVTHQPTNTNEWNDNPIERTWGVTDGLTWVDGISNHQASFVPFVESTNPEYWEQSNSLYYKIVQKLQHSGVELYWLGKPHRTDENFVNNWDGLFPSEAEGFTFAIADDASNPQLWTENINTYTAIETFVDGWVDIDSSPGYQRGQRIIFSGDVFGGIVAGKIYYLRDWDGTQIQISDTVDSTNNDGSADYPANFGFPGEPAVLTADTGSMTAKQYWQDVVWEGTAGDVLWACCNDPDYKWIQAWNLEDYLDGIHELNVGSWWNVTRSQSTFGIFPSSWGY